MLVSGESKIRLVVNYQQIYIYSGSPSAMNLIFIKYRNRSMRFVNTSRFFIVLAIACYFIGVIETEGLNIS